MISKRQLFDGDESAANPVDNDCSAYCTKRRLDECRRIHEFKNAKKNTIHNANIWVRGA